MTTDVTLSPDRRSLLQKLNEYLHFNDLYLLNQALTHDSHQGVSSNETLEFLGDGVLELIVRDHLIRMYPSKDEGDLTGWKTCLVNEETLVKVTETLELGTYLQLGEGEESTGGREKPSILSGTLEALIGGLYLEGGIEKATKFVKEFLLNKMEEFIRERNFKGLLQEKMLKEKGVYPEYRVVRESGRDHEKTYTVEVYVNGKGEGTGEGRSLKEAEMRAAQFALKHWNHEITQD
jgi:ribonuclease-3